VPVLAWEATLVSEDRRAQCPRGPAAATPSRRRAADRRPVYAATAGEDLVKAERALLDAAVALRERLDAHNAVVAGWRTILTKDFAIPAHRGGSPIPAERHGRIAPLGDGIAAGLQRINRAEIDRLIGRVMDHAAKVGTVGIDPASLPSALAGLVTTIPGLPDDARFYLGTGGAVLQFGPNGPDENAANGLVRELSRSEAIAIWDEQAA
jgi:hypothetical protein